VGCGVDRFAPLNVKRGTGKRFVKKHIRFLPDYRGLYFYGGKYVGGLGDPE
jgi:hypothetical protein